MRNCWADSAYRSAEIEAKLGEKGLKSRIHRKRIQDDFAMEKNSKAFPMKPQKILRSDRTSRGRVT